MFIDSLHTEKTRETYASSLKSYLLFRKLTSVDGLLSEDPRIAQNSIIDYIIMLKEKELSWQTRTTRFAGIKHFYDMNNITLNWKKITKFIGQKQRTVEDRAYTKEEVERMLEKCDERKRVLILLLASTSMRIGALSDLKLKHLTKMKHDLYQITVYASTTSQYTTFCTLECAKAIDDYIDYRKRCGEKVIPESPVIREQFNKNDQFRAVKAGI
ncbi:MAG: hypothetical protein AB1351_10510 [Thermoproteota archaeon]